MKSELTRDFEFKLEIALREMLQHPGVVGKITPELKEHLKDTPSRVVNSLVHDYFTGVKESPIDILSTVFSKGNYDQMIVVSNISFVSFCAHHLLPFIGQVHFGYLPNKGIVGLSKIPRLVEALSRRPQVQEMLTEQVVDSFMEHVEPRGCGVLIEAVHMCMVVRGVKKQGSLTETTALRGDFCKPFTKTEFLQQVNSKKKVISI